MAIMNFGNLTSVQTTTFDLFFVFGETLNTATATDLDWSGTGNKTFTMTGTGLLPDSVGWGSDRRRADRAGGEFQRLGCSTIILGGRGQPQGFDLCAGGIAEDGARQGCGCRNTRTAGCRML